MQPTNTVGGLLVAVLSASLAASLPSRTGPGSFKVRQVRNENFIARNPFQELVNMHIKYSGIAPRGLVDASENFSKALSKRDGSTSVATTYGSDYFDNIPVSIGSPAQNLSLQLHTGSSDLWVLSPKISSDITKSHTVYDPSQSKTSKKMNGFTWSNDFTDGASAGGDVYTDSVTIGGLTVVGQAVQTATRASPELIHENGDGVLGLAFSPLNTIKPVGPKTWFDTIADSLDKPVFTADLRRLGPGTYTFGAIPSEASDISYAEVNTFNGLWQCLTKDEQGGFSVIADTGITGLALDPRRVSDYYRNVKSAHYNDGTVTWNLDCNDQLPDYTFTVGDGQFTIPGSALILGQADPQDSDVCVGGIQEAPQLISFQVFGKVAISAAYVVFDFGNERIGWAPKSE